MKNFSYSVVIRTLGNTGEKYLRLLQSIGRQTVSPIEIVVALPDGYELDHRLGNERIVRCVKGMVSQRAAGIAAATGEYQLVVDDDIEMPDDFVERMYDTLVQRQLDCVLAYGGGCNSSGIDQPKPSRIRTGLRKMRLAFTGQAFYSHRKSEYFDVIASTGGHRTYVNNPEGLCQAGCFQCFFIKSKAAKEVRFEEEQWLEEGTLTHYAAYDDAVFFYKMYLHGGRMAYAQDTDYTHLDGSAGRTAHSPIEARRIRVYSIARNRTLFWMRLIRSSRPGAKSLFGGIYGIVNYAVYNTAANLIPSRWPVIAALFRGYRDAFCYYFKSKKPSTR